HLARGSRQCLIGSGFFALHESGCGTHSPSRSAEVHVRERYYICRPDYPNISARVPGDVGAEGVEVIRRLHQPMGGAADGPSTRAVDLVRWVGDHRVPHELAVDDVDFWLQRISPRPTT